MTAFRFTSIALLCLLQVACVTPQLPPDALPQPTGFPAANQREPLTPAQADEMMASVIAAINQNQAEVLVPYLLPRDQELEHVRAAIEDLQVYFQAEPIQGFERQPNLEASRFTYRVFSASGISKTISIIQAPNFQPTVRLVDEFFLYSRWAKSLVGRYQAALKTQDAAQLAKVLNSDDLPYPVAGATQAIETYMAQFELSTLEADFVGLEAERNRFIYRITGTKNGEPVEHLIQVLYGDGLVSLEDEFIPDRAIVAP